MIKLIPPFLICMIFALISNSFSLKNSINKNYLRKEKFIWLIPMMYCAVFAGLRIHYNDTPGYIETYEILVNSNLNFANFDWSFGASPGFMLVQMILKYYGFSSQAFLMLFSVITYFLYFWFIHKYTSDIVATYFLFMVFVFTNPMGAIRQTFAIALCLVAVDRMINKKMIWFIVFVVLAMTFHTFSLVFFLAPLLMFIPWKTKKMTLLIGVTVLFGIMLPVLNGMIINIADLFGREYDSTSFSGDGVNPLRAIVCLVPMILSYILKNQIHNPSNDFDRIDGLFLNFAILNGLLMFDALFGTAIYFARFANYFVIFPLLSIPKLLNMFDSRTRVPLKIVAFFSYLFFFYYNNVYSNFHAFDIEYQAIAWTDFKLFV